MRRMHGASARWSEESPPAEQRKRFSDPNVLAIGRGPITSTRGVRPEA